MNPIRFLVKVKTESGTHRYAALFYCTGDAVDDAVKQFWDCGAFVITVRAMP